MDEIRMPGIGTTRTVTPRNIFASLVGAIWLPGGKIIDGSKARDPDNTGDIAVLRAGLLMGKITSGGKYAPSVYGLSIGDYTSGGTELTVSVAAATEMVRRQGSSGTFNLINAPTAGGVVVETVVTYSAIVTSTGVITITDIGFNVEEGAIVGPVDGSEEILTILSEQNGLKVIDRDANDIDVPLAEVLVAGQIKASQIINYPAAANTTLRQWLKDQLNERGCFIFDDDF